MGFFLVLKAEVVRSWIIMRRYWFATLTGMIVGYAFLIGLIVILVGNREQLEQYADKIVGNLLGFIIGIFASSIVGLFTQGLQGMARSGELEQVCMSPHGLVTNFLARALVAGISSIMSLTIMLTLIAWTVKGKLHPEMLPTLTLLALTFANLIGLGFMTGGLVLVFKQTGELAFLLRMGLLGLPWYVTDDKLKELPGIVQVIAHILPVTDAAVCLKLSLVDPTYLQPSAIFFHPSFFYLLINCAFWNILGIVCFRYMENWSRYKGTLGVY